MGSLIYDDNLEIDQNKDVFEVKKKNYILHKSFDETLLDTPIYNKEMMDSVFDGIAQNVQMEMDKQGLTIRGLSELSGIHYTHLSRILNGQVKIGLLVLIKIGYALHVSPGDLFPFDNNKRKTNGQRFDDMTKKLDPNSSNFLLSVCADLTKEFRRISNKTVG